MNDPDQPLSSASNSGKESRPRNSSFISSLFTRSLSFREDTTASSNEEVYDEVDKADDVFSGLDVCKKGKLKSNLKIRSQSLGSESSNEKQHNDFHCTYTENRPISLSSVLLGTNNATGKVLISPNDNKDGQQNTKEIAIASKSEESTSVREISQSDHLNNREITQNDHLNKKLLGSFLDRINSIASNIIDPSGNGQAIGQVYSDDVMIDRIFRRTESDTEKK